MLRLPLWMNNRQSRLHRGWTRFGSQGGETAGRIELEWNCPSEDSSFLGHACAILHVLSGRSKGQHSGRLGVLFRVDWRDQSKAVATPWFWGELESGIRKRALRQRSTLEEQWWPRTLLRCQKQKGLGH